VQFFFESIIAILQLEGNTSAIAIPQLLKEMLLRDRNSAISKSQFFLKSATLELHFSNFWHSFGRGIRSFMKKHEKNRR
jgi:hypothetical protein